MKKNIDINNCKKYIFSLYYQIKALLLILILNVYLYSMIIIVKKKNIIPIAYGINDKYIYPLIVSLTSILYNSNKVSYFYFHILIPGNFLNINKKKIISLNKLYHNFKIIFHNLKDKYQDWYTKKYYAKSVYYRLSLSDLIKDCDKIIYLDCDTIVHKDISDLYSLEINGKYYMGTPGLELGKVVINGTRNFINSGVLLINLKELRKINATKLFEIYYNQYGTKKEDEYLINVVFYNYIGFLPFKFGVPDFNNTNFNTIKFYKRYNGYCNRTLEELIEASNNPSITHGAYSWIKWWKRDYNRLSKIGKKWLFYASKSNVYEEICNKYKQFRKICKKII